MKKFDGSYRGTLEACAWLADEVEEALQEVRELMRKDNDLTVINSAIASAAFGTMAIAAGIPPQLLMVAASMDDGATAVIVDLVNVAIAAGYMVGKGKELPKMDVGSSRKLCDEWREEYMEGKEQKDRVRELFGRFGEEE